MPKKNEEKYECPFCHFISQTKDSDTLQHLKNARREMLLAMKSLIEAGLSALDVEEKPAPKAKKVKVS
ncbi:MAG: hypothetical protein JRG97_15940 [Deltaproteobacteria bacterium]|nr:hypothetical protein [Deltaproteobacteria bacterium]MBW2051555.1 hypothetical protein [Deltaproteobacteria bacterium]MBW2142521.1 hypothetical protein [Deltaproteobacteria bacterium]